MVLLFKKFDFILVNKHFLFCFLKQFFVVDSLHLKLLINCWSIVCCWWRFDSKCSRNEYALKKFIYYNLKKNHEKMSWQALQRTWTKLLIVVNLDNNEVVVVIELSLFIEPSRIWFI